jgi:DNA-binding response OmpR family regulator
MIEMNATVLLVEGHKNLAEAVGNYLKSCGFTIDFAYDGLTGMHLATTNLYDAIILDIELLWVPKIGAC